MLFTDTTTGSSIPLDPTPTTEGNIEIDAMGRAVVLGAGKVPKDGKRRYTSHFVTCPSAKQFRKGRK